MSAKDVTEIEYCIACKLECEHFVQYTTMSNGTPWRKGRCRTCGIQRALPKLGSSHLDSELHFGKHKGKKLADVPSEYLQWVVGNVKLNSALRRRIEFVLDLRLRPEFKAASFFDGDQPDDAA